jgi:hypothetical protein
MKKINLFLLVLVLAFSSCSDIATWFEWDEVEDVALNIESDLNEGNAEGLVDKFDVAYFGKRLGSKFFKLPKPIKQGGYQVFYDSYKESMYQITNLSQEIGSRFQLFDIHKQNDVYRFGFEHVIDIEDKAYVADYLIFYLEKNKDGEWIIANFYDVMDGFSLGDIGRTLVEESINMNKDPSYKSQREFIRANELARRAYAHYAVGEYDLAYSSIVEIPRSQRKYHHYAIKQAQYSMYLGEDKQIEAMDFMKSVTPNEQSKQLYECRIMGLNGVEQQEIDDCFATVVELLTES